MPFRIDDNKLLVKYKTIWAKIEDLKNIELNALPVYEGRFIKTIIRTYGGKFILMFVVLMCQKMV